MITEAMVIKGLAYVGAWTISTKVIVPAVEIAGNKIGHGVGALAQKLNRKGKKETKKDKVEVDQATEQAIEALLAECDEALSEKEAEPVNVVTIVEEEKPEPKFDQRMQDWIQHCKDQYGGFANVVLD